MSEYQYYEFHNVSADLTAAQQLHLREISSRASISSSGFINEYHYGDLHAKPLDLMADFFDVGLYLANWGSAELYIKLPCPLLDEQLLQAFQMDYIFAYSRSDDNLILHFSVPENDDYFDLEGECGVWMEKLQELRAELYRGDYRCFYIIWLCALYYGYKEFDKLPLLNNSLKGLSTTQKAFAEFLNIEPGWVTALTEVLPVQVNKQPVDDNELKKRWLAQLTEEKVQSTLLQILNGQSRICQETLQIAYQTDKLKNKTTVIGELESAVVRQQYQKVQMIEQQQEEQKGLQEERKRQALRNHFLKTVYQEKDKYWQMAGNEADKANSKGYDSAAQHLLNLAQAYQLNQETETFDLRLAEFIPPYLRKHSFIKRLHRQGINV